MTIAITDRVGTLTIAETVAISSTSSSHRLKIIVDNPEAKANLQTEIQACVDSPNTICIGVSPKLRFTWTEIGLDTGIRSGDYMQVGRAGNFDFQGGRWADGIQAIIARAEVLTQKETAVPTGVVIQETVIDHGVPVWPFAIGFGAVGLAGIVVWYAGHRQQKRTMRAIENAEREAAELAMRNVRDQKWADEIEKRAQLAKTPPARLVAQKIDPPIPRTPRAEVTRVKPELSGPAPSSSTDLITGLVLGQALAPPMPVFLPTPTAPSNEPAPSSSSSWSSSSSDSGGGGGGYDSGGGGGGGSFDGGSSGGGGGGDF